MIKRKKETIKFENLKNNKKKRVKKNIKKQKICLQKIMKNIDNCAEYFDKFTLDVITKNSLQKVLFLYLLN